MGLGVFVALPYSLSMGGERQVFNIITHASVQHSKYISYTLRWRFDKGGDIFLKGDDVRATWLNSERTPSLQNTPPRVHRYTQTMAFIVRAAKNCGADPWLSKIGASLPIAGRGTPFMQPFCAATTPQTTPATPYNKMPAETRAKILQTLDLGNTASGRGRSRIPPANLHSKNFVSKLVSMPPWDWRKALDELKLAEEEANVDPTNKKMTIYMYGASLSRMSKQGRWSEALDILGRMRASNIEPNSICLSNAIGACGAAKKHMKALELLEEKIVGSEKLAKLDPSCISSAIYACCNSGETEKALQLLENFKAAGKIPNVQCYTAAISACGYALLPEKALELFEEMRQSTVKIDAISVKVLIAALAKNGWWKEGLKVYLEMKQVLPKDAKLGLDCLYAASQACGQNGDWKGCVNLLDEMRAIGITPNSDCYAAAIQACGKTGQGEKVLDLLAEVMEDGSVTDPSIYSVAIKAAGETSQWASAVDLLNEMKSKGLRPNTMAYR